MDGDYFLYTDAWNPTVIQLKYMAELLGVKIRIGGMWHAGSYDPADFLGRLIGDAPWCRYAEQSMFETYDQNFYATQFNIDMFLDSFKNASPSKMIRTGWPMEYLAKSLDTYRDMPKENLILFPHRIAPEKQPDIFRDLRTQLPDYEFIVCQDQALSKNEYHNLLGRAKIVFSANLQETLGISWYEGALVDTIPMVPDRLSYQEMGLTEFKYPSEWTATFKAYTHHKEKVRNKIIDYIENYESYVPLIQKQVSKLKADYFSGQKLYEGIQNDN